MLKTLAVANYRSINKLVVPLDRLNLITGPNGSGKSNLYRALRLLAETAQGGVINALAREGGLDSTFWAGPENISRRMLNGEVAVQLSVRSGAKRLRLGFAGEDFSYAISWVCQNPASHIFPWIPRSRKNASGPAMSTARQACWCSAPGRWSVPVPAAPGMYWPSTRPTTTACLIKSAACAARRRC